MTAITSILLALYENMSLFSRHRRSLGDATNVDIDHEFALGNQTVQVRARVTVLHEDDSDHDREHGYGGLYRTEVSELEIEAVYSQDGSEELYTRNGVDRLTDEEFTDLEAQVAEYAKDHAQ